MHGRFDDLLVELHATWVTSDGGTRVMAPEPRWPAMLAVIAAGVLHYTLPAAMRFGPPWLVLLAVLLLLLVAHESRRRGNLRLNSLAGLAIPSVLTVALLWGLGALVAVLPRHDSGETPVMLLRSAAALWLSNIVVFAAWYWRLDAGGPNARDRRASHAWGAFLFPQMTLDDDDVCEANGEPWRPGFVDYLFLAWNTSTALSPTDAPVLSRWAKLMMMTQSLISLTTLALLAARAVNIL
jgi:hypothetical protein